VDVATGETMEQNPTVGQLFYRKRRRRVIVRGASGGPLTRTSLANSRKAVKQRFAIHDLHPDRSTSDKPATKLGNSDKFLDVGSAPSQALADSYRPDWTRATARPKSQRLFAGDQVKGGCARVYKWALNCLKRRVLRQIRYDMFGRVLK